ncbi:hypothetical protein CONPUDRAFT_75540 [Coniophora puteana RWD-64-598 SS2]|uniref:DUF6533 domain-containing protein n=1 Tax=Coniophora puteana (strain RWD-64-598) TaxID=741705 RepID=A0A5M3MGJ2_CONPW|nr:uncharacterized protein CONPUDRAFT_75540 [Coniophora puteana RWD-64-598 SS2]EIW77735.1 hypothetical protein CONPUDRAFT_75540 [Coniophora puteana RWD-64-598 SS2]
MPYISNSSSLIPYLIQNQAVTYVAVSLLTVAVYDYVLSMSEEVLLIWQYGKSPLTFCYVFDFPWSVLSSYGSTRLYSSFPVTSFSIVLSDRVSQEGILLGIRVCVELNAQSPFSWAVSVVNDVGTYAYELLLVAMLVYRSIVYLREGGYTNSSTGLKELIKLLVGQGFLYFIWVLTGTTLSIVYSVPVISNNLSPMAQRTLAVISVVVDTGLFCMLGPWLILSIRRNHMNHLNGGPSMNRATLSSVAFASRPLALDDSLETSPNEDLLQSEA